jgi:hypothetical protein
MLSSSSAVKRKRIKDDPLATNDERPTRWGRAYPRAVYYFIGCLQCNAASQVGAKVEARTDFWLQLPVDNLPKRIS